jgi:predicted Zn-dependent peptidase
MVWSVAMAEVKIDNIRVDNVDVPVIFEQDNYLPIVSMQVVFKNAGSLQNGNQSGLARLSAKLLSQGTKTLDSVGFAKKLEDKAISLTANSGNETFVFEVSALKEHFDEGIKHFLSLVNDPNISEKALERVKTNTLGTLLQKENDFDYIAGKNLKSILFKGTALEIGALGSKESVEAITLKDIQAFLAAHLIKENMVFVVGGDIEQATVDHYVKAIVGAFDHGTPQVIKTINVAPKVETITVQKDTEQAYLYFGSAYNVAVNSPHYYKSRVAMFVLGSSGFGSRMMEEIRVKRGLAYSAYARASINKTNSYFTGYLQTKLGSQEEALHIVKEVISGFVKDGITKEELEAAKNFLVGSEPLRTETLSQRLSRAFNEFYRGYEAGYSKKELEKIEALTLDDINSFIKEHDEINDLFVSLVTNDTKQ